MPVVNTSALSGRIANWVMETACRQARAWELSGSNVRVAINLSPSQLQSGDLADSVAALLEATGLTASLLEIEVTEDILLHDERRVLAIFKRIQELVVRVLFDDFGTGYASLSYLSKFPLDGLKIDRSFAFGLLANSEHAAIVSSTIGLSNQLGLTVVAEGIENKATPEFLVSMDARKGRDICSAVRCLPRHSKSNSSRPHARPPALPEQGGLASIAAARQLRRRGMRRRGSQAALHA